ELRSAIFELIANARSHELNKRLPLRLSRGKPHPNTQIRVVLTLTVNLIPGKAVPRHHDIRPQHDHTQGYPALSFLFVLSRKKMRENRAAAHWNLNSGEVMSLSLGAQGSEHSYRYRLPVL